MASRAGLRLIVLGIDGSPILAAPPHSSPGWLRRRAGG
jgi:hypothetical protein